MNRTAFFDTVRRDPFGGSLRQEQVDGLTAILDGWETLYRHGDPHWLAYCLGTAFHETGATMQPVDENLNYSAERLRDVFPTHFTHAEAQRYAHRPEAIANRAYAHRNGNGGEETGEGWRYRGRGLVQLTGKGNYRKASALVDVDLVHEPEAAGETETAVTTLLLGMATGLYTGRKLYDYFNPINERWVEARAVVNLLDRAEEVARYGRCFYAALEAAA